MSRESDITNRLVNNLSPVQLSVTNESHMHSVPPGSESHFRVLVVSPQFQGLPLVKRHQMINKVLAPHFDEGLHALAMETFTPEEWEKRDGQVMQSPDCHGGSSS